MCIWGSSNKFVLRIIVLKIQCKQLLLVFKSKSDDGKVAITATFNKK